LVDLAAPISEDTVHDRFRLEGVWDARLSVLGLYS
jgi:hypothetical protein